jgi:lysophospholipase L1-like esterase
LTLAPVELIRETWNVTFKRGLTMDTTGESLRTMRLALPIAPPSATIPWQEVLAAYRQRLTEIVAAAQRRGVRLLLVSQPALWDNNLSPYHARRYWLARLDPPRPWDELSAAPLREHLNRFNREMQNVAAATQTPFLDAARSMNGRPEYFYDDYHFSEKGNEFLAKLIADHWPSAWAASRGALPADQ